MTHNKDIAFSELDIIYVLVGGGPGVGKGTQCSRLSRDFGFAHISVGDQLREDSNDPSSPDTATIEQHMKEGRIVPPALANRVLLRAIEKYAVDGRKTFLVDGFPRSMEQAMEFEKICRARFTLLFDAPRDVMQKRVLTRLETDGRLDDDRKIFDLRADGFERDTMPVVEYLRHQGKVFTVNCEGPLDDGYAAIKRLIEDKYLRDDASTEVMPS